MGSRTVAAVLLLCAALGHVACDSGEQGSEEPAPAEEKARTVTRTVTVQEEAAPPETTAAMETAVAVEASAEPT